MSDTNNNGGPACPGDDFLAKSDSDDTNELLHIIAKQPPEGADRRESSGAEETTAQAAHAVAGQAAYSLGDAVAAGKASSAGTDGADNAQAGTNAARSGDGGQPHDEGGTRDEGRDHSETSNLGDASGSGIPSGPGQSGPGGMPSPDGGQSRPGGAPNPGWGRAVYGAASDQPWGQQPGARKLGGQQPEGLPDPRLPGGGNVPPGGAWVWLPQGVGQKKPWRKRHPIVFWGGVILVLALVFGWGRMSGEESPLGGPKIAVINVEGMILDADNIVAFMEKVRKDDAYKGAVLRINSPGGAVGPSQEIYAAAKRLAEKKPLVASMGALAASGGYYAALGAETILAGPSTLTASIGVKMQIPNIEELMRTVGISEKTLTTGALKDAGSSWRPMAPEEEAYFMALIMDMYDEFIETVARERGMGLDDVRALADGRAMTGRQALAAGLVDGMGDKMEAVRRVKSMAGLGAGPVRLVSGPEKPGSYLSELVKSAMQSVLNERATMEQPRFFY